MERSQNLMKFAVEADIHYRADDLGNRADAVAGHVFEIPV